MPTAKFSCSVCGFAYDHEAEAQACAQRAVLPRKFKVGDTVYYHTTHTYKVQVDDLTLASDKRNPHAHANLYIVSTKQYVDGMPLLVREEYLEPLDQASQP